MYFAQESKKTLNRLVEQKKFKSMALHSSSVGYT
jgi:hypothetical protein